MARIYRLSDRITVKVDDLIFKLAPLSTHQKTEIQQAMLVGRSKVERSNSRNCVSS